MHRGSIGAWRLAHTLCYGRDFREAQAPTHRRKFPTSDVMHRAANRDSNTRSHPKQNLDKGSKMNGKRLKVGLTHYLQFYNHQRPHWNLNYQIPACIHFQL
jgi:hypothetical protein